MSHINYCLSRRIVSVVATWFAAAGIAFGQSYSHSPNDTLSAVTTVDNSVTLNITQLHPGNDTLQFVWKKLSVSMPAEWTATICDNNTCYPTLIDSASTLPVLPGDDGLLLVHCSPYTTPGIGVIRYTIYELNTPQQVDTLTWIIEAVSTAGISDQPESEQLFSLTGNYLTLKASAKNMNRIRLIDSAGKVLFASALGGSAEIELPELPAAVYVIELSGNNSIIQKRIWYSE